MNIIYSKYNTHVENSYLLTTRQAIKEKVEEIIEYRNMTKRPVSRSTGSYIREWVGHNRLYNWNIARNHTKDVDLDENMSMFWEIVWLIIGGI